MAQLIYFLCITAAEIQAELEKEEAKSVENVATIKHRERNYMGMLEYKKENEGPLIKTIITGKVALVKNHVPVMYVWGQ